MVRARRCSLRNGDVACVVCCFTCLISVCVRVGRRFGAASSLLLAFHKALPAEQSSAGAASSLLLAFHKALLAEQS